ncbi:WD40 domain-containing protein [Roseiflexus castenholzii]|jgi:WD40 repeat protein|uniref:Serine/threonine protein kinase with WD40 repeats n=1 Tax=Roseiflexus castenholzii (strain DSM 13941 / HLO8) TaxID=383372 RepID=A7NPP3_ROSCS|nr:PQQ-binding-like beta-propeller repeat protein [Roseiflexus castenholzii]ABU59539.1 serine/threonine protein kinase with WD40 repeats [Roseiflexus castenholzii DSM 13941]
MSSGEQVIRDRYRVIYTVDERPGVKIYRCRDDQSGELLLVAGFAPPEGALSDLDILAKQIAAVRHEALLPLRDHFAEGALYYMVCADPGGQDVERAIRARGGPLPETDVLTQATRLLLLLEHLHNQRPPLFLGDLAVVDVWVNDKGSFLITPFTLATPIGQSPSPYRAPELSRPDAEPTTVSDVYTIGALMYHALTGWAPPTPAQQEAGMPLAGPRSLNPHISPLVEQVLLRALQLRPVNRFQQAREMRIALETAQMMGGRSLGLGPDVLTHATPSPPYEEQPQQTAENVVHAAPGIAPPAAPAPVPVASVAPPPAAPAPYPPPGYPTGYAPAPPRQGLSTGCLVTSAVLLTVAAIGVCLAIAVFLPGSPLRQMLGMSGAAAAPTLAPTEASPAATVAPTATSAANVEPTVPPPTPIPANGSSAPGPDAISPQNVTAITATRQLSMSVFGPVAYSPDGRLLAVGISEAVSLHDATTLDDLGTWFDHTGKITSLAWSADSTLLASGASDDNEIRIWDVSTGRVVRRLSGHTGWIRSIAFAPNGTLLASGSTDQTVRIWDAATGQLLATLSGHTGFIGGVVFSPDSTTLASASRDGSVRLWDVASGREISGFNFRTPLDPDTNLRYWATGVAFSPDGKALAVGSTEGVVYLLDAATGQVIHQLRGHTNWIVIRGLAFAPDGKTLYSAGLDATVRIWDVERGVQTGVLDVHRLDIFSIAISPNGERLASVSDQEGRMIVWDLTQQRPDMNLRIGLGLVTSLVFSPDSEVLGAVGYNGIIQLRLLANDQIRQFAGSSTSVQSLAFLPNGRLATITEQDTVVILDFLRETSSDLTGSTGDPLCIAADPGGKVVAAGANDGTVAIWNGADGQFLRSLKTDLPAVFLVAVSDDGAFVAAAGTPNDPRIEIWRVADGQRVQTLSGMQNSITSIAFQPRGTLFAATGTDGVLRMWNYRTGASERNIKAAPENGWFTALAFSPDGAILATGTPTGVVQFWNPANGAEMAQVQQQFGVLALTFSPDGAQLAAAGRDAGVTLYRAVRSGSS